MPRETSSSAYIFLMLAILIAIVVGYFLVVPAWSNLSAKTAELDTAQKDLAQKNEQDASITNLQTQLDKYASDAKALQVALPNDPQFPEILVQIENMAAESGVTLKTTSFAEAAANQPTAAATGTAAAVAAPRSPLKNLDVGIEVDGSYAAVKAFVDKVGRNLRILDAQTISLKPDEKVQDQIDATFKIQAYYLK